jgi:hypothetical protein
LKGATEAPSGYPAENLQPPHSGYQPTQYKVMQSKDVSAIRGDCCTPPKAVKKKYPQRKLFSSDDMCVAAFLFPLTHTITALCIAQDVGMSVNQVLTSMMINII